MHYISQRGNASPQTTAPPGAIEPVNKSVAGAVHGASISTRPSYHGESCQQNVECKPMPSIAAPAPNLISTGQPLSIPQANLPGVAGDAMNGFPKESFLSRGRKRPSAEHREEPPTSRLRREISQEQTPQRHQHDGAYGLNQGSASESRSRPGEVGHTSGVDQTWEIPGVTTIVTHVSLFSPLCRHATILIQPTVYQLPPNQCQTRLNWCNRELFKLMDLKIKAMDGHAEIEDPEMLACQM